LPDSYHPHLHLCATDGGYKKDGRFVKLGDVREKELMCLKEVLRRRILSLFVKRQRLADESKEFMRSATSKNTVVICEETEAG
jgi:hypothetical protein